jgi:type IV secretory pathway TraG/TraD family ATPase VirD4
MSKGPYVGVFRQAAGAWIVLAVGWGVVLVGGLLWLAGNIATWLMGKGFTDGPAFDFQMGEDLFLKGPSHLWPSAPVWLVFTIFGLLLLAIGIPATIVVVNLVRGQMNENDPLKSLAADKHLTHMTEDGVRERAFALRPELADRYPSKAVRKNLVLREAGVPLGTLRPGGTELRASWEDVAIAIMAPRSGKTTALAIPAILDAPGAVVVTSNKADVWAATWELRESDTREDTWLFDPQGITHRAQTWWWNPLRDVRSYDSALRLATHFMQEVEGDSSGEEAFWMSAATDLLTAMFLAAGLKRGGSLYDVYEWLSDPGNHEPITILTDVDQNTAASLKARQEMGENTRESVYEYARTACRCLRNPSIMAWVIPPHITLRGAIEQRRDDLVEFHPRGFAASRQTMYLLSKDGAATAAPLVAALTDRLIVEAEVMAEGRYRGRLDPPMLVCLDEAANICKIADLPLLYSHMGSRGIFLLTIFQSRPQARSVWGRDGFETMWSAATVKLVGAGIDDPDLADDISRLVGEHDITIRSVSTGAGGSYSESVALRKQAIMSTSDVRAMAKGTAVLLATGALPASVELQPWYRGPRADEIKAAVRAAHSIMEQAASAVPMELVTVNAPLGNESIDLRDTGTVSLDKPVSLDKAVPERAPAEQTAPISAGEAPDGAAAATGRTVAVITQDGEPRGSITVDDDPTRVSAEQLTTSRQDPSPKPPVRARRRRMFRKDN